MNRTLSILTLSAGLIANLAHAQDGMFFAGSIVNEGQADNLIDLRDGNGGQATIEGIFSEQDSLEVGLRTPFTGSYRLSAAARMDGNSIGETVMGEKTFENNLVRAGYFGNQEHAGVLAGGRFSNDHLTIDGDIGNTGIELEARGYIATINQDRYLGLGGKVFDRTLTSIGGLLRKNKFGFYNEFTIDYDDGTAKGKFLVGNHFTLDRDYLDSMFALATGTEFQGLANGTIWYGWPAFDAFCSEGLSLNINWNAGEKSSVIADVGYNIDKSFTATAGLSHNDSLGLRMGLFTAIPKTHLEAWLNADYNLKKNKIDTTAYVGYIERF